MFSTRHRVCAAGTGTNSRTPNTPARRARSPPLHTHTHTYIYTRTHTPFPPPHTILASPYAAPLSPQLQPCTTTTTTTTTTITATRTSLSTPSPHYKHTYSHTHRHVYTHSPTSLSHTHHTHAPHIHLTYCMVSHYYHNISIYKICMYNLINKMIRFLVLIGAGRIMKISSTLQKRRRDSNNPVLASISLIFLSLA